MEKKIDTGISDADRQKIADGLVKLLADSYTLMIKTHNFHWNVTGPHFAGLHTLFETQYTELFAAVDEVAERIRALGYPAPGTLADFTRLNTVGEQQGVPGWQEMVKILLDGQEAVIKTARAGCPAAEEANDQATLDLLTERLRAHEKSAWMLRALLA